MANMQVLTLGEIAQLTVVRTPFYPVFLEAGLLGIFFVLVCTLVTLSFRRGVCSRAQSWIVVVTVMMFIVDGAHWGSGLALAIMVSHKARTPASTLPPISYTLQALLVNIQYINIMLSDIVIVWRTWLIWERHIAVLVVSAALYTMTSAAVLMSIMIYLQVVDIYEPTATQWTFSHFAILASSAGMNLWTVSLIAIRAWRHRRLMDDFFGQGTRRTKAEKALSLLVESGIVMSILLVSIHALQNKGKR
ncbi:hypothetical protein BC834DRAFT_1031423 [Gloeopeniophorella convolvens]|nr:hypothetical protein BC834DRAFT_1031423 [Gloeopeniophorella convolvens]